MNAKAFWRCKLHITGVEPGTPPFYVAGCCECERKKAAGLITGRESPPLTRTDRYRLRRETSRRQRQRSAAVA